MSAMFVPRQRRVSVPTYSVEQVPANYKETYIIRGYRQPRSSVRQCLVSVFTWTNETLNFWTHFLAALYFAWVTAHLSSRLDFRSDPTTWPLLVYLSTCCLLPLTSAMAHLFNVLSDRARHVCFFFDYLAIALYTVGVAVAYRFYCFPTCLVKSQSGIAAWYRDSYILLACANSVICTYLSCRTRFSSDFNSAFRNTTNLAAFAFAWIFDTAPIFYRCASPHLEASSPSPCDFYLRSSLNVFLAAFLYGSHLPERLLPGKFDIFGHSHQLFHLAGNAAMWFQLQAVLEDFDKRQTMQPLDVLQVEYNIALVGAIFCVDLLIVLCFTIRLFRVFSKASES